MRLRHTKFALLFLSLGVGCFAPQLLAKKKADKIPSSTSDDPKRALHALNRLTFGPRPGDTQQVMAMGVDKWIDLQLHPERIDDSALDARLEPLRTLRMSNLEIAEDFPDQQIINQVMNGKRPMPTDPARRAVYEFQLARLEARKEHKEEAAKILAMADRTIAVADDKSVANATTNDSMSGKMNGDTYPDAVANNVPDAENNENMKMASGAVRSAPSPEEVEHARRREAQLHADDEIKKEAQQQVQEFLNLPPDQRYQKVITMSPAEQGILAEGLRGGKAQEFLDGMSAKQRETLLAMNNPTGVVSSELAQAKLLRAIYSQRQLEEVMTDFWFNHFNVFEGKGVDRIMVTSYERDVIRPHALGKFEDLLVATAKSPAMLFYLDNWQSMGPNSAQALGIPARFGPYGRAYPRPQQNKGKRASGLNENYGRELLELHTLSVNGGYSQRDVTEVAKVFTGWTIDKPAEGGGFKFDPRTHEPGPKFVLGRRIKPKGEAEGLEVLHRLATSPQTAHFISLKLAERFISDDPPKSLVDQMAKTFLKKKGDIREVLLTIFHSPEFWNDTTYRAKVKTPLEFVASAVRATGAEVDDATPLARQLNNMGMPLYGAQPPTGYSMKAETWVSSSALLNRMNFALALTGDKIRGVKVDATQLTGSRSPGEDPGVDAVSTLSSLEGNLIASGVSKQTHDSIVAQFEAGKNGAPKPPGRPGPRMQANAGRGPDVNMIAGLLIGSPEFQRK
jgi:uncharacterized protein (DUF1800 family)